MCGKSIKDVDGMTDSIGPEKFRELSLKQKGSSNGKNVLVFFLNYAILWRSTNT